MKAEEISYASVGEKYFNAFLSYAGERIIRLSISILGDYNYDPKNKYSFKQKQKIFKYLKAKYITTLSESQEDNIKKLTSYNPYWGMGKNFSSLSDMKNCLLSLRTNIEAGQQKLVQVRASSKLIKSNYFNEIAYEFDKQRYCSMAWGLLFSAIVCSTIYGRGSITRKAALFLTSGHAMGQFSYYLNIDKYFDTINSIFEEDALEFQKMEQRNQQIANQSDSAGIVDG